MSDHDQERFDDMKQHAARYGWLLTEKPALFIMEFNGLQIGSVNRCDGRTTREHLDSVAEFFRIMLK